jgi:hypothetical protein
MARQRQAQVIYARAELTLADQLAAASRVSRAGVDRAEEARQ